MENFQLQLLFKIIGLGSASGLLHHNNVILAISDNSSFLYEYNMQNNQLQKHALMELSQEGILKIDKPDFESITQHGNDIYIFGSGSTEKRKVMVQIDATTKEIIKTTNMQQLYTTMQSFGKINPEKFNLEGAIYNGENWLFFNRGNGKNSKNAIFTVTGENLEDSFSILHNTIKLPKIKGVETSFTDAIMVNNKIYFLASAEDTYNTYDDGEVFGSIIGIINPETMKVEFTKKISNKAKLEGLALFSESEKEITFLICEDNDTEVLESNIYKLVLEK